MELSNEVWLWLILGGILLVTEMFTGTFYLLFFGIAALVTAIVAYFEPSVVIQVAVYGILAMLSLWYVKKRGFKNESKGFENDLAQTIEVKSSIKAGQEGTIQYQGSPWTAFNSSNQDLVPGDRARILKTEGIKLYLAKVGE